MACKSFKAATILLIVSKTIAKLLTSSGGKEHDQRSECRCLFHRFCYLSFPQRHPAIQQHRLVVIGRLLEQHANPSRRHLDRL